MKPKTNIAPSRKPNLKFNLDSTLIKPDHIPLFSSWIDKKDSSHYNKKKIPYDFKLLYRASRDGLDTKSFHRNCNNKGATIWVAKVQGSTQLIGGYNPLDWSGNGVWKNTTDSFQFNFTDGKNISTAKLGYVNVTSEAVYCHNSNGPRMGDLYYYSDNNCWYWYNSGAYYPNIDIPTNPRVEGYEVFQVIKHID